MISTRVIDDKYEIVREIKRGGFGVVYEGVDRVLGKRVAVKAVDSRLLGEARYIDMFRDEALAAAQLNHHNIVQILDIRRGENGQIFIIMEYIDGPDLHRLLRACARAQKPLPLHLGVYIITEVCSGLDYAHNRRDPQTQEPLNIVHQDISPSNIMVTSLGEVKIIDFGMANVRRQRAQNRREVVIQGKLNYLAPEQLNGAQKLDRRVDIFALGLVLYELIQGERLIQSKSPEDVIAQLRAGKWDFSQIEKLPNSEKLVQALRRSLAINPEKRYQSANQMYMDLMHYLIISAPAADFPGELAAFVKELQPMLSEEPAGYHAPTVQVEYGVNQSAEPQDGKDPEALPTDESDGVAPQPDLTTEVHDNNTAAEIHSDSIGVDASGADGAAGFEKKESLSEPILDDEIDLLSDDLPSASLRSQEEQVRPFGSEQAAERPDVSAQPETHEIPETQDDALDDGKPTVRVLDGTPGREQEPEPSPNFYTIVEEPTDDEEELKTIIDVVRLSTRSHKKALTWTFASLVAGLIMFTVVDTFAHFTSLGTTLYDFLFPPAIKIVSIPPGAQVYLDDKPLQQTTPLSLAEISPGVHKLMLTMGRFDPIVKSIHVPRKGELRVAGEKARHPSQPYVFRFKTRLELSSHPPGAMVYIDGVKLAEPTPTTVYWEVGDKPLSLRMTYPGLPDLEGLSINTLDGTEIIDDRRFWRFQRLDRVKDHFAVEGIFRKPVVIKSIPQQAEIYVDEAERPSGITGLNGTLLLTLGPHLITLRKSGYLPREFSIEVNENTPEQITQVLLRRVRIYARDVDAPDDDVDLGAQVVSLQTGRRQQEVDERTPAEFRLPPYRYTAVLRKSGYQDLEIEIPPNATRVVARMKKLPARVAILVVNAQNRVAESGARVICRDLQDPAKQYDLGITDENGSVVQEIPPGRYQVQVEKEGYTTSPKFSSFDLAS